MSKQTAVEWLVKIYLQTKKIDYFDIEQAKEMFKEEIKDAYCDGVDDEYEYHINNNARKNSEQYYNETFNK